MLEIIFLISIILVLMLIVYLNNRDFISPVFLVLCSFFAANFMILLNYDNWMIDVNVKYIFIIIIAIVSFIIGAFLIEILHKPRKPVVSKINIKKNYPFHFIHICALFFFVFYIIFLIKDIDLSQNISSILREIYEKRATSESGHFLLHQFNKASIAIAYISYFELLILFFNKRKGLKNKMLAMLPIFYSLISMIVSTDRNILVRFFIYVCILWVIFYQRFSNKGKIQQNKKIFIYSCLCLMLFLGIFFLLGKLKQYTSDFERMIGIYIGSGSYNFNLFLNNENINYTYGKNTFTTILGILGKFNFIDNSLVISPYYDFITFASSNGYIYSSNIYSGLYPYYVDFGILGIIIFPMIMGLLFEFLYVKMKNSNKLINILIYSTFIYPVIYISIVEQFFQRMHFGLIYEVFWLFLFYNVAFIKHKKFYVNKK